jgi:hypothetical protein
MRRQTPLHGLEMGIASNFDGFEPDAKYRAPIAQDNG